MKDHIQAVHHVAVSVPDLGIARKFYLDLLGGVEYSSIGWEAGNPGIDTFVGVTNSAAKSFLARLKNLQIEVFEYTSPEAPAQDPERPVNLPGYTHIAFQVDDVQAAYDRMVEAGLKFNTPPNPRAIKIDENGNKKGYSAVYGRDFFGNVFELVEIHRNDLVEPI